MKKKYYSPVILEISSGGEGDVSGAGSGQGSVTNAMPYEEWWADIAWEGANPDADYNGDGEVNRDDYDYYIENELWLGD